MEKTIMRHADSRIVKFYGVSQWISLENNVRWVEIRRVCVEDDCLDSTSAVIASIPQT